MRRAMVYSILDQAVLSAFNLGLSLLLVATVAPAEFGRFSYVLAILLILGSVHNALVATPIGVSLPGQGTATRADVLSVLLGADHRLRVALMPVAAILLAFAGTDAAYLGPALALCFFSLWRETQRGVAFALSEAGRALVIDLVAVSVSALAAGLLWRMMPPVPALLSGMAAGSAAAVAVAHATGPFGRLGFRRERAADVGFGADSRSGGWRRYGRFWHEARWSLLGAVTTEAQFRGYVFAVQALRGAETLGAIQAGRALMGPLPLLASAWSRVARPEMTRALVERRDADALRTVILGTGGVLFLSLGYLAALALAWPWIEPRLFGGRYPGIGVLTAAWGLTTLIGTGHICLGTYLQAARCFRPLAFVSVGGAAASAVALAGLATAVPTVYAVGAVAVGETVALVWSLVLVVGNGRRSGAVGEGARP
ncbi:hypothetical protein [Prosthecodimorpha staleyi]|uniref:Uncharacterized protein n=1 Tax=Prosthecodimorpha staleyi TaxID=2840188 RepID=A0A947GGH6_9HYPH|nr:hypothetical protein [Prosthecodimorpha staleyi]MBT9292235.1 hypothetical protein [Prosthecodimorpha staleyi]